MNLDYYRTKNVKHNPVISIAYRIIERLFMIDARPLLSKKVDDESNGRAVEKQLRCAVSGCFDKYNICCKACDIKKCRYKCNHIDEEVCEHQFI